MLSGCEEAAGSFEQSDLRRPWPCRRALLWVLLCSLGGVVLLISAVTDGRWYLLLMLLYFAVSGLRTVVRLLQQQDAT